MPDEVKPAQNTRQNNNRGGNNNRHRNNRSNNRPNNRPQNQVQTQVNHFEKEAAYHSTKVTYWRKRVNGFSAFTLIYAAITLSLGSAIGGIQSMTALGLVAFTLLFLILNAAKNYQDHKSNEALNKYRHNILMTAESMASSTKDPVTKEEIMLEALSAIGSGNKD